MRSRSGGPARTFPHARSIPRALAARPRKAKSVVVVFLTGVFATNFFGARLIVLWHEILHRIPVVNSIYSSVKQISDTLFSSSGQAFRKALLVQWPRENMWTIAFLTGTPGPGVARHLPPDCLAVCVPTTPNPTGGYFLIVART